MHVKFEKLLQQAAQNQALIEYLQTQQQDHMEELKKLKDR